MDNIKEILKLALYQFCIYSLSVYGWRLIASDQLWAAVLIDIVYSWTSYFMIQTISTSKKIKLDLIGITIGVVFGTIVGMKLKIYAP